MLDKPELLSSIGGRIRAIAPVIRGATAVGADFARVLSQVPAMGQGEKAALHPAASFEKRSADPDESNFAEVARPGETQTDADDSAVDWESADQDQTDIEFDTEERFFSQADPELDEETDLKTSSAAIGGFASDPPDPALDEPLPRLRTFDLDQADRTNLASETPVSPMQPVPDPVRGRQFDTPGTVQRHSPEFAMARPVVAPDRRSLQGAAEPRWLGARDDAGVLSQNAVISPPSSEASPDKRELHNNDVPYSANFLDTTRDAFSESSVIRPALGGPMKQTTTPQNAVWDRAMPPQLGSSNVLRNSGLPDSAPTRPTSALLHEIGGGKQQQPSATAADTSVARIPNQTSFRSAQLRDDVGPVILPGRNIMEQGSDLMSPSIRTVVSRVSINHPETAAHGLPSMALANGQTAAERKTTAAFAEPQSAVRRMSDEPAARRLELHHAWRGVSLVEHNLKASFSSATTGVDHLRPAVPQNDSGAAGDLAGDLDTSAQASLKKLQILSAEHLSHTSSAAASADPTRVGLLSQLDVKLGTDRSVDRKTGVRQSSAVIGSEGQVITAFTQSLSKPSDRGAAFGPMPDSLPMETSVVAKDLPQVGAADPKWEADLSAPSMSEHRASPVSTPTVQSTNQASHHAGAVIRQMMDITVQAQNGVVELRLSPDELGRVRMHITAGEHGVIMHITAERPDTLDLLRRNIDQLQRDLTEMGYENPSFSFERQGQNTASQEGFKREGSDLPKAVDPADHPMTPSNHPADGLDIRI